MTAGRIYAMTVVAGFIVQAISPSVQAESPEKLVRMGNGSFRKGEYREAMEYYDRASVREPESPIIFFNRGSALYKSGEFQKAAEEFLKTAEKTRDLPLEARAWYNMGNCSMMQGKRQSDSDMKKALDHYRSSVTRYQTALKKDSTLHDAAVNMEIARVLIKDLLDRIRKQEEMRKKQQERMKEIVDSLVSIANRQDVNRKETGDAAERKKKNRSGWKQGTSGARDKQEEIREDTRNVRENMENIPGAGQAKSIQQAISHVDSSLAFQDEAVADLAGMAPEKAREDQEESLE
ncbi:MAG: tetratricopeptide repeat protein, partial [Candidatus Latescibacteria bacterium]|nr:tetratricopeptide repeat protein [bacterium]MBD3424746.1 tetratricopeptide repeat protein [Candidatus Latescibacterota bacterium]